MKKVMAGHRGGPASMNKPRLHHETETGFHFHYTLRISRVLEAVKKRMIQYK